ncbi:MAG: FCD domain-containing protein [Gammaproteobacteria bacterium]|nr:FCD domain-containing protein [Gammaproteobacteria bacterium]
MNSQNNNTHLRATSGAAGIFNGLRERIVNGDYNFNERLPSERDLALKFAVARGTVRAALEQLEQAGLVVRKFGSGTFVSYNTNPTQEDIAEETSPLELIETRLAIEPHIVKLVVSNANNREIRKLKESLEKAMLSRRNPNDFSKADEEFHLTLAHCSQNPLLIWIYQRINDIRSHTQWSHRKNNILTSNKIDLYNKQHEALLDAIKRRDAEGASNIMTAHLIQAKKDLLGPG